VAIAVETISPVKIVVSDWHGSCFPSIAARVARSAESSVTIPE
jgi:hypothetical protein